MLDSQLTTDEARCDAVNARAFIYSIEGYAWSKVFYTRETSRSYRSKFLGYSIAIFRGYKYTNEFVE